MHSYFSQLHLREQTRKYANNAHFSKYLLSVERVSFLLPFVCFNLLEIWFCWCDCHRDLWRCCKINHLNFDFITSYKTNQLALCLFCSYLFFLNCSKVVCAVFSVALRYVIWVKVQMHCRRIETAKPRRDEKKKNKKKPILIAAKCLISVHTSHCWEMGTEIMFKMIWQALRAEEKKLRVAFVIFHLHKWNMVCCICAINHLGKRNDTNRAIVHLLRLFEIYICIRYEMHWMAKCMHFAVSTLISPNFFIRFLHHYVCCCEHNNNYMYDNYQERIQFIKNPTNSVYFTLPAFFLISLSLSFLSQFSFICCLCGATNSSTITNFTD